MQNLEFIGKDPESGKNGSPTVFVDPENSDFVIQGWKADEATLTSCSEFGPIPEHETAVRVPARMLDILREACDDAERRR